MDARVLVFGAQSDAAVAVGQISQNMGLSGSSFLFAIPAELADGRWYIPHPSDDGWLSGVSGYTVGTGLGLVAVGEPVPSIPASVAMYQARSVLLDTPSPTGASDRTLFMDIDDGIKALSVHSKPYQAWEYSNNVDRDGEFVTSLSAQFGLTSAMLDALFIAAAKVKA